MQPTKDIANSFIFVIHYIFVFSQGQYDVWVATLRILADIEEQEAHRMNGCRR